MDTTETLLKELTEAHGVSGYEAEVRAVMRRHLEPLGVLEQDKIGSLICRQAGTSDSPRVMLAAHMDEIGFMIKQVTKEGFLRFVPLGGWFDQVLLGQRVVIRTTQGDVVGVIGAKPPHTIPPAESAKVVEKKSMYIDIGATSAAEVEAAGVRAGDPVVPLADFRILANPKTYLAKAFDDRVGCASMVRVMQELAKHAHPNTIYAAATVMEEVGLRGATTSVELVHPDVAIILESDISGDVPGIGEEESAVKLGRGPTMVLFDARMIPHLRLRDLVVDTAREAGIPLQTSFLEGGATDGAPIHLHHSGVPTVVLGVAARHIHSHSSIIHRDDFDHQVALVAALVRKLDATTVGNLAA